MATSLSSARSTTQQTKRSLSQEEKSVVLPPLPQAESISDNEAAKKNPFVMPPDYELFTLREAERRKLKEERAKERKLRVHEKSTYASRVNAKMASLRQTVLALNKPDSSQTQSSDKAARLHKDTQFVLATTRDRRIEKEDINGYINKKREMFLMQYSLGVKRDEIKKLEDLAKSEERKLEAAEKYLEQSAAMFDEFLKENDKNSVEASKMAESATKAKLEKVAEIKRLNAQIMAIKSEISRNDDQLNELKTYRSFLSELSPEEWKEQMQVDKESRLKATDADGQTDDHEELFFTHPKQLLDIFTELEEQNLSLIQNGQETEETLEEMRQSRSDVAEKLDVELSALKQQVNLLEESITKEEEKAYDLEMKSKMFSFGEFRADDQESMLQALDKKVAEVYTKCIGGNESTMNMLQMLAAIECRMEELFEDLETLPVDKVEAAEKAKDKERRMRMREQKLEEQRLHQEERLKRALERAQADPKKRMGRKLVYRSEPPVLKRKQQDSEDKKEKEEEELHYFFS